MTLAAVIPLVLRTSIVIMVFALGLTAAPADLTYLLRRPWRLLRSLASMYLVMLVAAVLIARLMDLPRAVEIVIVALALAPIPPILPKKQAKAGGNASYAVGLVVAASLFAIAWIPVALSTLEDIFHLPLHAPPRDLASLLLLTIFAPLSAGAAIGRFAPGFAARIGLPLSRLGSLLLLAALLPILLKLWRPLLIMVGDGTLLTLVAFVLIGLFSGHLLGGPDPNDRSVLALASASRHPGIAMFLASLNFPQEKAVTAVILLYLLTSAFIAIPYIAWRKRVGASPSRQT